MKNITLLFCLITLTGCSLITKPSESIINSGSTASGIVVTGQISTGINFLSGENIGLSGSNKATINTTQNLVNNGVMEELEAEYNSKYNYDRRNPQKIIKNEKCTVSIAELNGEDKITVTYKNGEKKSFIPQYEQGEKECIQGRKNEGKFTGVCSTNGVPMEISPNCKYLSIAIGGFEPGGNSLIDLKNGMDSMGFIDGKWFEDGKYFLTWSVNGFAWGGGLEISEDAINKIKISDLDTYVAIIENNKIYAVQSTSGESGNLDIAIYDLGTKQTIGKEISRCKINYKEDKSILSCDKE